jgi:tRNA(adenine34) deaminase
MDNHEYYMQIAIEEARQAFMEDEVPVGAVLVIDNQIVLKNHNRTNQLNNPLAHAEMLIINEMVYRDTYKQTFDLSHSKVYLHEYTLYVTLEPCLMCSGAIILSRLGRLVFGCHDPKTGVVGSVYNVLTDKHFNHHPIVLSGVMADECSAVLKDFFRQKR